MRPTRLLVTFAALAALAACSQGTSGGATGSTSNPVTAASSTTPSAAATAAARPTAPEGAIKVSLTDFAITPATLTAKAGSVVFFVSNDGRTPHNLSLFDSTKKDAGHTADLNPGQAAVLTVTLAAGSYHINCSLPGHESLGMSGTLTVS